jgi:hypothetical protein
MWSQAFASLFNTTGIRPLSGLVLAAVAFLAPQYCLEERGFVPGKLIRTMLMYVSFRENIRV